MKVCIVGCGPSGLVAAKHLKEASIKFDAFERTEQIGGTWVYTEQPLDSYGQPVHTAMYQNLRTNFPKELMEFEGLYYSTDDSFLRSSEILQYLNDYASKYDIMTNIKVGHMVKNISLNGNSQWDVTVENLQEKIVFTSTYDSVIICNGHHFTPRYPVIEGMDRFKGCQIHSKDYRKPDIFSGKTLLVIGFGYSGQDMTLDACKTAKSIFVSHHSKNFQSEYFPKCVTPKPDVLKLNVDSVTFEDGSVEKIDAILYCTGYKYSFPFLDSSCGVTCDGDYVSPLYRHSINIQHPTMAFIGLNFSTIVFFLFEAQVKAFVKVLQGESTLPTEEEMTAELNNFVAEKRQKGIIRKKYHMVEDERAHFKKIHDIGNLLDLPEVIYKIYYLNFEQRRDHMHMYRNYLYRVINKEEFSVELIEN